MKTIVFVSLLLLLSTTWRLAPAHADPKPVQPLRTPPVEQLTAQPGVRDLGPAALAGGTLYVGGPSGKAGMFAIDAAERAPELRAGQAIDPRQGIAATTFYDQIKRFFEDRARVLQGQGDAKGAERFTKASTHWIRHSHASRAIAGGMPIEIAQQNLGHASLATTTVYVTTKKRRRMKAVEAFWKR